MAKMNELYEKVAASEKLQAEVAEITQKATKDNVKEIQSELIAFGKKQGYEVTSEEIEAFFSGMAAIQKELNEAELDAVAGGKRSKEGQYRIAYSVLSLGVSCAVASIKSAFAGSECTDGRYQ